jgi:hypothetical protein
MPRAVSEVSKKAQGHLYGQLQALQPGINIVSNMDSINFIPFTMAYMINTNAIKALHRVNAVS